MTDPLVPQRTAPGVPYSLSAVALELRPPPGAPPSWSSMSIPLMRKARSLGVTTFDLGSASAPSEAVETLVRAFPEPDPALTVILGTTWPTAEPPRGARSLAAAAARGSNPVVPSVEESLARLGGRFRVIVDCETPSEGGSVPLSLVASMTARRERGDLLDFAMGGIGFEAGATPGRTPLRSGPVSLLDVEIVNTVRAGGGGANFALLAREVFAGGALDGSLLSGGLPARGPAGPPPSLSELQVRLDPVLRLGFLTRPRTRTLAHAALEFALSWPWVLTAIVPIPTPERLASVLGATTGPGFSEEELARLGVVPPAPGRTS